MNNELENLYGNKTSNLSVIDFKECVNLLKKEYEIDEDIDLIILKYENITSNPNEKSVQYEIYAPNTTSKLNLSICSEVKIDIYIPVELDENTQKLYDDLKSKGYNLFDKNDKFYKDICTPYKSEDGTDILLADRYNDIYTKNQLTCQANCEYSDYSSKSQYLKCECNIVNEEKIETKEPHKVTAKSFAASFYNILKYSNYKVLSCYNLVFRKVTFTNNAGFLLSFIYFLIYLASFGFFLYKKILYLKSEISKIFSTSNRKRRDIKNLKSNQNIYRQDLLVFNRKNIIMKTENALNKKKENKNKKTKIIINDFEAKSAKDDEWKINNMIKNLPPKKKVEFSIKIEEEKIIDNDNSSKMNSNENKNLGSKELFTNKLPILDSHPTIKIINTKHEEKKELKLVSDKTMIKEEPKKEEKLSDYEMNNLEYLIALELDDRKFIKVYWSLLKREHTILFTFFSWNDYNIFSIKLTKFIFLICTDMAFNVFFFSDDSMHNLYDNGGDFDFFDQLVQFIYTIIISQAIQVFLNYLTMTDTHYYYIKGLKNDDVNKKRVVGILNCIIYKIIVFYVFTFIFFLFYMFLIASFCAVYENTQVIFITDSILSFVLGLVYPFILYFLPTGLRFLSLKAKKKKNLKLIYWLSDVVPFF